MTTREEMLKDIARPEYSFLKTNPHLGDNIILLGLGGSHAYGTDIATSDWDWRGVATRTAKDILTGKDFEQVTNNVTDTTVYSFDKIIKLLCSCNPNTIEMLGLKPEHYLYVSPAGQLLLDNADLFLSKRAVNSFGGYAMAQLNRLSNKSGRANDEIVQNEARSLQKAINGLKLSDTTVSAKVEQCESSPLIILQGVWYLDDFVKLYQVVDNVHTDYRNSTRNNKAVEHGKLNKHMMHLCRLYFMAIDILRDGKIVTYREKEHDFLMDVRNGKYLENGTTPTKEFMNIVADMEKQMKDAAEKSELPDKPDQDRVDALVADINEAVVTGGMEEPQFEI